MILNNLLQPCDLGCGQQKFIKTSVIPFRITLYVSLKANSETLLEILLKQGKFLYIMTPCERIPNTYVYSIFSLFPIPLTSTQKGKTPPYILPKFGKESPIRKP